VAAAVNQPIGTVDPTAHPEVRALRAAAQKIGNYRLTGAYTVCDRGALRDVRGRDMTHARIGTLIFGPRSQRPARFARR
jgi:tRNA(adenine34) deaminase